MAQRGMPGAEIVERHLTAGMPQRVDEAGGFLDVVKRRGFGDLDDQPRGEVGPVAHFRNQCPKPRPVGRGQTGDVEAELDRGMGRQLGERLLQDMVVDQPDKAELLDHRHEIAAETMRPSGMRMRNRHS